MYNILIFGDSISTGRGVNKNKSWPFLLARDFDNKDKYSTVIHNLSIPGESTSEVLFRFFAEAEARYKRKLTEDRYTIIFAVGINDAKIIDSSNKARTSVNKFKRNIKNLIQLAYKYTNHIIFLGLTMVDENKTGPIDIDYFLNKRILKYNNIIKDTCTGSGVFFLEIAKDWRRMNYKKFLADDGIHLNELGHKMVYKKITDFINSDPKIIQF